MEKFAIVTGGSSGLGQSIASILSTSHTVIVWDRSPSSAHTFIECDVTNPKSVQKAVESSLKISKKFDVLVNSAGIAIGQMTVTRSGVHDLSSFQTVLRVNVIGLFDVCRSLGNYMDGGVIINIASMAAFEGQRGQVAYSASKGAVVGLTVPMSREFGARGVRVVCICPGMFETPMTSVMKESVRQSLKASVVLGRLGRPDELGHLIKMCVENQYLNGCNINIHGGSSFPNI